VLAAGGRSAAICNGIICRYKRFMLADQECTTKDTRQQAMTWFCNADNDPCLSASIHAFMCIRVLFRGILSGTTSITPLILYDRFLLPLHACHSDHQVLQPARSVQNIFSNRLSALLCYVTKVQLQNTFCSSLFMTQCLVALNLQKVCKLQLLISHSSAAA